MHRFALVNSGFVCPGGVSQKLASDWLSADTPPSDDCCIHVEHDATHDDAMRHF